MNQLVEHYIPEHLEKQIQLGCSTNVAICLGEGTNYSIIEKLNKKHHFFKKILKLAHPRYIMQYKRKMIDDYVEQYVKTCQLAKELAEKWIRFENLSFFFLRNELKLIKNTTRNNDAAFHSIH